jgi:L-asparaginase II
VQLLDATMHPADTASHTVCPSAPSEQHWAEQPVVARLWRANYIESQHRGAWVLADTSGAVVDGEGDWNQAVFPRSATKSLQALPLLESGAAERFGWSDDELALALASHHAEPMHVQRVTALLERHGLRVDNLQCGSQAPMNSKARRELLLAGERPTAAHNNCSGKHTGFLALARHLGADVERYLDPRSPGQLLVRAAVAQMSGVREHELHLGLDGCSAPTFHLPLVRLATALARVANPEGLEQPRKFACLRLARAVERFPELIGASTQSLCSDLARVSGGRLFPKLGTEAVYVVGIRGAGLGLAVKIDDGAYRAMNALVIDVLERTGHLSRAESDALAEWRAGPVKNWAGLEVGRLEVVRA